MKRTLFLAGFLAFMLPVLACTTFFLNKDGHMVFGRNYDWVTATGTVHTNLRGLQKTSLDLGDGKILQWVSRFGSLSFNQYGKEFPTGGMNEKGLVVELMWLSESRFPAPDERPALSVLQWIQYQLDNCSTVEEVMATDQKVRISARSAPQHYLVADSRGDVATIEFLEGKMVVHTGKDLPYAVLANSPYAASVKAVGNADGKKDAAHFKDNSLARFSTACRMVAQYREVKDVEPGDYAFSILQSVAQPNFTRWSIVYDITQRSIRFITSEAREEKKVNLEAFDFSCTAPPLAADMNAKAAGDMRKLFIPFSAAGNSAALMKAFDESRSQISIDRRDQEAMALLASRVKCK